MIIWYLAVFSNTMLCLAGNFTNISNAVGYGKKLFK